MSLLIHLKSQAPNHRSAEQTMIVHALMRSTIKLFQRRVSYVQALCPKYLEINNGVSEKPTGLMPGRDERARILKRNTVNLAWMYIDTFVSEKSSPQEGAYKCSGGGRS